MSECMIPNNDLQLLASESDHNLNMILAEMTTLMESNNAKVQQLENQNWFQRMSMTISGKNKMTQAEIQQNHDAIDLYVSQAMGELFNRNCIDHELILGLGNKINALYESQIEIKQIIGAFAQKLNQKIESIDNFHMLIEEINQGLYNNKNPFLSISQILSQLDLRTVQDQRKMDILTRSLEEQNILNHQEIPFCEMLENLLSLDENKAGTLALFFGNIRDEYVAKIAEDTIFAYYTLPEKTRKMKSRRSIVETILRSEDVDLTYSVSSYEMCQTLIEASSNYIVACAIEAQHNEEVEKRESIEKYVDESTKLLQLLSDMAKSWDAENGELNTRQSRKEYSDFMQNVIDQLDFDSYIGSSIANSLNNLTFFAQNLFAKYIDPEDCIEGLDDRHPNKTAALPIPIDIDKEEFQTVSQHYKRFINVAFHNEETGHTRQLFAFDSIEEACSDFPDTTQYTLFQLLFLSHDLFIKLYRNIFKRLTSILENSQALDSIYNLCQRFPVTYDNSFEKELVHKFDLTKPYIEIEYPVGKTKETGINYASVPFLEDYGTTVLRLKFKNMPFDSFSVNRKIIENEYFDFETYESHKYVDVEWGEWVDHNVLELKLSKYNDNKMGTIKIKITIVEDPSIVAFIQ